MHTCGPLVFDRKMSNVKHLYRMRSIHERNNESNEDDLGFSSIDLKEEEHSHSSSKCLDPVIPFKKASILTPQSLDLNNSWINSRDYNPNSNHILERESTFDSEESNAAAHGLYPLSDVDNLSNSTVSSFSPKPKNIWKLDEQRSDDNICPITEPDTRMKESFVTPIKKCQISSLAMALQSSSMKPPPGFRPLKETRSLKTTSTSLASSTDSSLNYKKLNDSMDPSLTESNSSFSSNTKLLSPIISTKASKKGMTRDHFHPKTRAAAMAVESSLGSTTSSYKQRSSATQSSFGELSSLRRHVQKKQHQQRFAKIKSEDDDSLDRTFCSESSACLSSSVMTNTSLHKKKEWLERMNLKMKEIPVGELDPDCIPISAVMNACAKLKSSEGAAMVEMWLSRIQEEHLAGNSSLQATTKMYTMAVDAWAKSGEKGAAVRAESLLQHMHNLYQADPEANVNLKPTTGIFNAVINAWARSKQTIAPNRARQILEWMEELHSRGDCDVAPDKYTFNTVLHAYAKNGGKVAALKAQELLTRMNIMYARGNTAAKPDTITYNIVINCLAKSGRKGAAYEAEALLSQMHNLHEQGDHDVKPNVITYGAIIDAWAKSQERGAASRADSILAHMIELHQSDPIRNAGLMPNTYVFNTVINCWAKSKDHDAASKAEEMLVAMRQLHSCGMPGLKPDAFTYTAVIDAWSKSGCKGAAHRANQLLEKMEVEYQAGDTDLKPNSFTYNAVINALAKSKEPGAAAKAERVLQNMVNRFQDSFIDDIKPTTINFNTVLDAWAKSGEKGAAERAEGILKWMQTLNFDIQPDTITFNAIIDAWARSGDRRATRRAEQILGHMDSLYEQGNKNVKPDTYTYNTLINAYAKSGGKGAANRAEQLLQEMERRYRKGDASFRPNTRTYTSVIDAWAKSGQKGSAFHAEQILNTMIDLYESTDDVHIKPNVHTANAVMNACAFTKNEQDWADGLEIAFRVFDWLSTQHDLSADAYTYTILLSACSNLLPREEEESRFLYAKALFEKCTKAGCVNSFVLRKLKQTVSQQEYSSLVGYNKTDTNIEGLPSKWTRNTKHQANRNRRLR